MNQQYFKIGYCSDAWKLRCIGDPEDVIDHRPFTPDGDKTPVGICADAPVLVLYTERGKIDWEKLLGLSLLDGSLLSGAKVKIIYLLNDDQEKIINTQKISLKEIKELALKSQEALKRAQQNFQKIVIGTQ
ncbi:hypothetical protein [Thermoanaerobacterium thermosaccharolyticum]|uniref:hypothetical protein n=1 Tax=Thermoanaerobacterium thermosaccharolyticum TaxID=1517 RepID=UPI00177B60B4|nr:hypothetical protein [Thermoanaerobacterium thermosaccharolyticum]MBE0228089.1 hypothetical protein [Thermoanaerobacterium thermosaccharolyticum]